MFSATEAYGKNVSKTRIKAIISECKHYEGAEVLQLGRFSLGLVRGVLKLSALSDPDVSEALCLMDGVHGISIFDFEDCSEADRQRICKKLDKAFSNAEMLMEASGDGDRMSIYGVLDEKTDTVKDFVLYTPSDYVLICVFGTVSMDAVAKLAEND